MAMPKPYRIADSAIEKLTRKILRRSEKAKRKLTVLGFDELNVMNGVDSLYVGIGKDCRQAFREIYVERYVELLAWMKKEQPEEDYIDEIVEMYLAGMWEEPSEVTHYAFGTELIRKRDRAKEAILAVPTKTQKQIQFEKAIRYVTQQAAFYIDLTEDAASLQAFKDAEVKKVRWNVYGDDRVCADCKKLDGNIYPINKVPVKPHPRCRCYLTPVN